MKKLFFAIMAASVMASCSSDETIDVVTGKPIAFGNPFVENSTRAVVDNSYGGDNKLEKFNVYGTVTGNDNTVNIYNGDDVTSNVDGDVWNCTKTQYWIPGADYKFMALVDATKIYGNEVEVNDDGMPTIIKYDVANQADLLYAVANRDLRTDNNTEKVSFTFNHLLAKAMFTFTNGFTGDSKVNLTVADIKITNVPLKGNYDINKSEWTGSDFGALDFGTSDKISPNQGTGTSGYACVLIPGEYTFSIAFTVRHDRGGNDTPMNYTTGSIKILAGHSYNFTCELNAANVEGVEPIEFKIITDEDWSEENKENEDWIVTSSNN